MLSSFRAAQSEQIEDAGQEAENRHVAFSVGHQYFVSFAWLSDSRK
jgi:hypothetical protein